LGAFWAAGWVAGGLVFAGGVDVESAEEPGGSEEAEFVAAGDDEDVLAGMVGADADSVALPADGTADRDEAQLGVGWCRDRFGGCRSGAGCPAFEWGRAVQGAVGSALVVEVEEPVELGLKLGDGPGLGLAGEPAFEGLVEPFDLPARLGMRG